MTAETLGEFRYGDTLSHGFPSRWRAGVVRRRKEKDNCNEKRELDAHGSSLESWPTMTAETLDEFRYGDT
ncbi:hypothetical protein GCM10023156_25810 [Novipirellula rosea]|uniref:Uncharacterized protein n=1 Tax=Novipirellula rosea TaxID=1031540 RepID=A0ABP8MPT5_9BACT